MQLLVCLLMIALGGLQSRSGPVSSGTLEWRQFRDQAHRVSFAYPPGLHPVISPAGDLRGIGGWVSRVLLVGDDPGGTEKLPVLDVSVFVCDDPALDPRVPCVDDKSYRKVCDRFEKFPLGDATAIQCVSYGKAACQWSAVVPCEKVRNSPSEDGFRRGPSQCRNVDDVTGAEMSNATCRPSRAARIWQNSATSS
jgi:hypothetical protein